jgi:hypothetical protein
VPIVVPPFVAYQAPLYPLRGLWNSAPEEGDRFVSAEIDWGVTTGPGMAVQFLLSGNSPVAFSQIVALQCDNTSNAADVSFLFPDSAYTLVVPAYAQGVFPVFTNALMFYVVSTTAVAGDRTLFQVLNSMPPPVAVQSSRMQQHAGIAGLLLNANGSTPLVPAGVNGTLESVQITGDTLSVVNTLNCSISLGDGSGGTLWVGAVGGGVQVEYNIGPILIGFQNGINFTVSGTNLTGGFAICNLYYGVP